VHRRHTISEGLERLLEQQEGVVSRSQALGHGLTAQSVRRLLAQGAWLPMGRGVFRRWGGAPTLAQRAWAGHLAAGNASVIGGAAALALHKAGDDPADDDPVVVWLPPGVKRATPAGCVLREDFGGRVSRRSRGMLPLISLEDALIDLAEGRDAQQVAELLTRASRSGQTTPAQVRSALRHRPGAHNRRLLLTITGDLMGLESGLEWAYRTHVERAHGLPHGERQATLVPGSRVDVWYRAHATIVEVDGRAGHVEGAFRDLDRDNRHALRGQLTLRFGSADVRGTPCVVAAQPARALMVNGWAGPLVPCPSCAAAQAADDHWSWT